MKFQIFNRWTGSVQFEAEIGCGADATPSVKTGLAVRGAVSCRTYLSGADLRDANISGANIGRYESAC